MSKQTLMKAWLIYCTRESYNNFGITLWGIVQTVYKYTFTLLCRRFLKKLILIFNKDALNWSKVTIKAFVVLQFLFEINAVLLNFLFIKEFRKNVAQIYSAAVLFSSLIKINVSWAANQYISMISGGSCDTEDWSNDAENSALHLRNKLHLRIYSNRKQTF